MQILKENLNSGKSSSTIIYKFCIMKKYYVLPLICVALLTLISAVPNSKTPVNFFKGFQGETINSINQGAPQQTVDEMTKELCEAMEIYNDKNPDAMLQSAEMMMKIADNKKYATVTEKQLMKTMKQMCPKGYAKFKKLAK